MHEIESRQAMDEIDVLRQVVTDPDYVGKREIFGNVSPTPMSVQEQKAQAMNKLAAFKKSADILSQIKNRLGKDDSLKAYLVNQLENSGSELGEFYAQEMTDTGDKKLTNLEQRSEAFMMKKQE